MPHRLVPIVCPFSDTSVRAYYLAAPRPTLIDTGGAAHPAGPIAAALTDRGAELRSIELILNSHGHWDHAGGNAAVLDAAPAAEVWIHGAGAPLLHDIRHHLDGYFTETARLLGATSLEAAQHAEFAALFGVTPGPSQALADGDRLDLGDGIVLDVLHLPGHSADCVGFYWEREGILLAGDAAQGTGSRVGGCPLYFGSPRQARASIARLREIPFRRLQVAHPFGRPGHQERLSEYGAVDGLAFLDASLAALDALEEALRVAQRALPDGSFPDLARAAVAHLVTSDAWPLHPDDATGMPPGAAVTLHRLWREQFDPA